MMSVIIVLLPVSEAVSFQKLSHDLYIRGIINVLMNRPSCMMFIIVI